MPNSNPFKSDSQKLFSAYNKNKSAVVRLIPTPVCCEICNHCWYQAECYRSVLLHQGSSFCCVYSVVQITQKERKIEISLEEIVKYCCTIKCIERDSWQFDPIPHNKEYCEKRCPITLFVLNKEKSI